MSQSNSPAPPASYPASLLVLHGPNLNLLGSREPEHYGDTGLEAINERLLKIGEQRGVNVICRQSNAEHELIDWIQRCGEEGVGFIVINPAAYTHTSVAIRDALVAVDVPFIEVHLSNVHKREPFRKYSYFSDAAEGVITGMGADGYEYACRAAIKQLQSAE